MYQAEGAEESEELQSPPVADAGAAARAGQVAAGVEAGGGEEGAEAVAQAREEEEEEGGGVREALQVSPTQLAWTRGRE